MCKYGNKKRNALQRGIPFTLTKEDFDRLQERSLTCDYTGVEFSEYLVKSVERIDNKKGYTVDNCCIVLEEVNKIKGKYLEVNRKPPEDPRVRGILNTIKRTLKEKTREELTYKYRISDEEYTKMSNQTLTLNKTTEESTTGNTKGETIKDPCTSDLSIAKQYIDWVGNDEERASVSLATYKRELLRKSCKLSGVKLDNSDWYHQSCFVKLNKNKPFSNSNIARVSNIAKGMLEANLSKSNIKKVLTYTK
jgi:hypothetical protein